MSSWARPDKAPARKPARLRDLSKARTRQALIDAALACFSESGIDAPSLDAICERAGCTRGAFYVHFADREALVVAAMESRRNAVLATFLEGAGARVTVAQVLELFAKAVEAGAFPIPGAVRAPELLAACRRSSRVRNAQIALMKKTAGTLEARLRSDQVERATRRDVDAAALADLLLAAESGVELLLDLGYPLDVGRAARALGALLAPQTRSHGPRSR
jgi:AcrR family transcriptional regulator